MKYKNMFSTLGQNKQAIGYVLVLNLILLIPAAMSPMFKQVFTDYVLGDGVTEWMPILLIVMFGIATLASAVTWLQKACVQKLSNKIEISGISKYIWLLLTSPLSLFSKKDSYLLISQADASKRISKLMTRDVLNLLFNIISVVFYLIMMLRLDLLMTGIVAALVVLTFIAIKLKDFIADKLSKEDENAPDPFELKLNSERTSALGLEDIETFKATASESFFYQQILGSKIAVLNATQAESYEEACEPLGDLPEAIFFNVLLLISAFRIMDRSFSIGTYLAFQAFATAFFLPLSEVLNAPELFRKFEKRLKKLYKELDSKEEIPVRSELPENAGDKLDGHIVMKDVSFAYDEDNLVLQSISLNVKPGQRIAIVGNSGAGKTTLLKLLQGLHEPIAGEVTIDGVNPARLDKELYANSIGCANQEVAVFAASVRDNITLWDESITDAQIYIAASDACIHDYIALLDGAYDYLLFENGGNLSGGQKQRIEMARVFLNNPSVIFLDEATSAIDSENRGYIEQSIVERGCSCVVVTHDVSRLGDYDEIILLNKGKVSHRGTHDELLRSSPEYLALFQEDGMVKIS
ncbi:MAG: ATP-binding cassette domain-containing protein [Oscillospiraceae bacterium]|nr:ATP-binding cassette domain-containing protein [Oscillospiraceae bacterium]